MKVLIVDDNETVRRIIKNIVVSPTVDVYECEDGSEAFELYTRLHPDLVLMDVEMRDVDGITATREIIKVYPKAKIIIVTSYDHEQMRQAATHAGASGFIGKENLFEIKKFISNYGAGTRGIKE